MISSARTPTRPSTIWFRKFQSHVDFNPAGLPKQGCTRPIPPPLLAPLEGTNGAQAARRSAVATHSVRKVVCEFDPMSLTEQGLPSLVCLCHRVSLAHGTSPPYMPCPTTSYHPCQGSVPKGSLSHPFPRDSSSRLTTSPQPSHISAPWRIVKPASPYVTMSEEAPGEQAPDAWRSIASQGKAPPPQA